MQPLEVQPGAKHPRWRTAVLVSLVAGLCLVWVFFNLYLRLDFVSVADDYPSLSLGHAINIEHWLSAGGTRPVDYFQTFHPGIPLQISSWLVFRVTRLFYAAEVDPIQYTLQNPEPFWLMNQLSALLFAVVGMVGIWWLSRPLSLAFTCSAMLVFFSIWPALLYGLLLLGNDAFALPLGVIFFALAGRAFATEGSRHCLWAALGGLGGLAYLVKLNYLAWPMAAGLGLLAQLVWKSVTARQFAQHAAIFIISFLSTIMGVGSLVLGTQGVGRMLTYHWRIFSHAGLHGYGEETVVKGYHVHEAITVLRYEPNLWRMSALLVVSISVVLFWRRTDQPWLKRNLPFAVCLVAALVMIYGATLKHFSHHYLVPAAAVLPLAVVWLGRSAGNRLGYLIATAVIGTVCVAGNQYYRYHCNKLANAEAVQRDAQLIRSLPLTEGHICLWSYRVNAPSSILAFTVSNTSTEAVWEKYEAVFPHDMAYCHWSDTVPYYRGKLKIANVAEIPWQYAVFDRATFPVFESLPVYFREYGKQIGGFKAVWVVVRSEDLSPGSPGHRTLP